MEEEMARPGFQLSLDTSMIAVVLAAILAAACISTGMSFAITLVPMAILIFSSWHTWTQFRAQGRKPTPAEFLEREVVSLTVLWMAFLPFLLAWAILSLVFEPR
jgi:uncharacterized RDD family membrane protein YckC